jgi:hypothetical protein
MVADPRGVGQLGPDDFGEVAQQGFGFVREVLAGLDQADAGVVPQGQLLPEVVGTGVAGGAFERHRHRRVRLDFAGDAH